MGNIDRVIDFLENYRLDGPWTIWAQIPDTKAQETQTFFPQDRVNLRKFLERYIDNANLYFIVNPTKGNLTKNPNKEAISRFEWLHVDADPDPKNDFVKERKAILQKLSNYSQPPTLIIDSGGGYQAFWRLDKPVPIISDKSNNNNISQLEAYNRQLATEFHADNCHNINRLMRLPYTHNLPNDLKRKRGRVKAETSIVAFTDDTYSLNSFTKAEVISSNISYDTDVVNFSNLPSVDVEMFPTISTQCKEVILGNDARYGGDRSKAMFFVACHMYTAGCTGEDIAAVLLDKNYKISEHVYDQRNPEEYVKRQIRRAKEFSDHPMLVEMNDKYCVVQDGSKTRILSEGHDEMLDKGYIRKQTKEDFNLFLANKTIEITYGDTTKTIPLSKWWLQNKKRRSFNRVVFAPNMDIPDAYNMWRGFNCEAKPGNWTLFKDHIKEILCNGDEKHFEYFLNWMAYAVQYPHKAGQVAVVLNGQRGSGKGFFAKYFGKMFGRHYLPLVNTRHVVGNFNAHLRECVVMFADEAFFAGDRQSESVLKALITEDTLNIEQKGYDVIQSPNCVHMVIASNDDWSVPAGMQERRFFVLNVSDKHLQDHRYIDKIEKQMLDGGLEAMLYELQTIDLSKFIIWEVPKTDALLTQQKHTMSAEYKWWFTKLNDGMICSHHLLWEDPINKQQVFEDYIETAKVLGQKYKKQNLNEFFAKVLPTGAPPKIKRKGEKREEQQGAFRTRQVVHHVDYLVFPTLADCRDSFLRVLGRDPKDFEWDAAPELEDIIEAPEDVPF